MRDPEPGNGETVGPHTNGLYRHTDADADASFPKYVVMGEMEEEEKEEGHCPLGWLVGPTKSRSGFKLGSAPTSTSP